jgi:hypothetical protein
LINPPATKFALLSAFFALKKISAREIHREFCEAVYGQNVMSEGTVRQLCKMLKDGRTNVPEEERSGRPHVVSDILFKVLAKKFVKDGASQFQNFRVNFHNFTHYSLRDYYS